MDINLNAPIIARHDISISASLETVWELMTRIAAWPEWNPDIRRAEPTGPIAVGTIFHWETAGLAISSVLGEFVPLKRLAWSGEADGVTAIHVWTFAPNAKGTYVHTEESWE